MEVRPDGAQFWGTLLGNGITEDDVSAFPARLTTQN